MRGRESTVSLKDEVHFMDIIVQDDKSQVDRLLMPAAKLMLQAK